MRSTITTTIATYGLLTLAGVASFMLPSKLVMPSASAEPAAGTIVYLPTMIRDFHKTGADLTAAPSAGNGHYAGSVAVLLGADKRPAFAAGGFKVATQWRDKDANNIAPHMYGAPSNGNTIRVVNAPTIANAPTLDTFNSAVGAYGGANIGPAPTFVTGSTMPTLVAPTGFPPLVNAVIYQNAGTSTLSTDVWCNTFNVQNSRVLQISGNVRILTEVGFAIQNASRIDILPNSSLEVWCKGTCVFGNDGDLNKNTMSPPKVKIYNLGATNITIGNSCEIYARIISPNASVVMSNDAKMWGSVTAKTFSISNTASIHVDTGGTFACGIQVKDLMGTKGANSTGGIVSAASFAKWFNDVLGTNMSMSYNLPMTKNSSTGVYEYLSDQFFPIDNIMFGNEGQAHNYYFTCMIEVKFNNHNCSGTFFEFQGADDCWMSVENRLAIDLGGVLPNTLQRIDMDRLELVDGQTYTMRVFFAQRNTTTSSFHMRTNVEFVQTPPTYTMTTTAD